MILTTAIEEIWPHLDQDQIDRVNRLIPRAEAVILQRFPTVLKRISDGTLSQQVVAGVIEDMVTRVIERDARGGMDKLAYPEVSMEWDNSGGVGVGSLLYLTTDELILLSPPRQSGAFTITPTGGSVVYPRW